MKLQNIKLHGVEVQVGQLWLTRGGEVVRIECILDEEPWPIRDCRGYTYKVSGCYQYNDLPHCQDLVRFIAEPGFTPWNGGECPADGEVEYILRNGERDCGPSDCVDWSHEGDDDIIAYRKVNTKGNTPTVEVTPSEHDNHRREFWCQVYAAAIVHYGEAGAASADYALAEYDERWGNK